MDSYSNHFSGQADPTPAHDIEILRESLRHHQEELRMQQDELDRTSQELALARRKFAELRDNAPVAYLTHDRTGLVHEANKRARKLLGLQPCQKNFRLTSALSRQAAELFDFHMRRAESSHSAMSMEFTVRRRGSKDIYVLIETSVVERDVFQSIIVDITKRKESEQVQKKIEKNIAHSQKLEVLHQLSGGVAHDFNNILQVMMLQAELAQSMVPVDEIHAQQAVTEILATAERGMELTRRLLAFTRKTPLEKVRCDLNDILNNSMDFFNRSIGENWKVIFDQAPDRLGIWVDPVQIEQVVVNLCLNARDAMPDGGVIELKTDRVFFEQKVTKSELELNPGNYARISIIDEGTGISESVLSRIFEPFFTTKAVGKGTGLGMSMVHSILRQHQGAIEIESTRNFGTTVHVYIPGVQLPATTKDLSSNKLAPDSNQLAGTVLICDDEPTILSVLCNSLESLGLKVFNAQNGSEACEIIENEEQIGLLLTDMVLPDFDGRVICEAYRNKFPAGAVVFMSGHGDSVLDGKYIHEVGATFLQKPFTLANLQAKLGLHLIG